MIPTNHCNGRGQTAKTVMPTAWKTEVVLSIVSEKAYASHDLSSPCLATMLPHRQSLGHFFAPLLQILWYILQ